jgi:cold shock protein
MGAAECQGLRYFKGGSTLITRSARRAKLSGSDFVRSADTPGAHRRSNAGRSFPMAMTGTVKFFNGERGYGFIKPDDGGRDVFVHITAVERAGLKDLAEGQRITFEVEPDKKGKGPKAVNLVISS